MSKLYISAFCKGKLSVHTQIKPWIQLNIQKTEP